VSPRRRHLSIAAAAACLAAALAACSDDGGIQAVQLLARANALGTPGPSHRGQRVVEYWNEGEHHTHRERIFVGAGDDLGMQLVSIDGAQPEPTSLIHFVRQARYLHRFRDLAIDDPALVLENYDVEVVSPDEVVAGRSVVHLLFQPRHKKVGRREVWVDKESGVALRVERYSREGSRAFRVEYESIELGGTLERIDSDPPQLPAAPVRLTGADAKLNFQTLEPTYIPKGYRLADSDVVLAGPPGETTKVRRDRFTDGLDHVLVLHGDGTSGLWNAPQIESASGAVTFGTMKIGLVSIVAAARGDCVLTAFGRVEPRILERLVYGYRAK